MLGLIVAGWLSIGTFVVMYTSRLRDEWSDTPAQPTRRPDVRVVPPVQSDYAGSLTQRVVRHQRTVRRAVRDTFRRSVDYVGRHRNDIRRFGDGEPVRRHGRRTIGIVWDTADVPLLIPREMQCA